MVKSLFCIQTLFHAIIQQKPLERPKRRYKDTIKMDCIGLKGYEGVDWIHLAYARSQ
jgi:hypothetical protein